MNFIIKLLLTAVAVTVGAHFVPGVHVANFKVAVIVALVLAILNAIVKPILVILTIPITILTLGLFLLVINVIIIYMTDSLVDGFSVAGFIPALIFGFLVSIISAILESLLD